MKTNLRNIKAMKNELPKQYQKPTRVSLSRLLVILTIVGLVVAGFVVKSSAQTMKLIEVYTFDNCPACDSIVSGLYDNDSTAVIVWECGDNESEACSYRRIEAMAFHYPVVDTTESQNQAVIHIKQVRDSLVISIESNGGYLYIAEFVGFSFIPVRTHRISISENIDQVSFAPDPESTRFILFLDRHKVESIVKYRKTVPNNNLVKGE